LKYILTVNWGIKQGLIIEREKAEKQKLEVGRKKEITN
jgi:hypothetical protein